MITNSMGAKKVEGTDNWREIFDAHNDTADALEQMGQDVAPIVNGNKSVTGAASGEYVLVRNSSITGITDGAYKAAQAIPANTAIDSTYLTAITGGIANDLNSKITAKEYTATPVSNAVIATVSNNAFKMLYSVDVTTDVALYGDVIAATARGYGGIAIPAVYNPSTKSVSGPGLGNETATVTVYVVFMKP